MINQERAKSKPQPFGNTGTASILPGDGALAKNQFAAFPKDEVEQSIPQRFEKIVRQFPDRIAVKTADQVVSYAELNAMANGIAHAILAKGSTSGQSVGIILDKGIKQVAAMLGILKAGKFFVLLDSAFPQDRIAANLHDSGARLVVSDERRGAVAKESSDNDLECIVIESVDVSGSARDLRPAILPSDSAYLVYTSGSTGQPKAVIQTHRNLLHRVMLHTRDSRANEQDRMALLPSGTSNAITHTFTALLTGATLCPFDVKKEGVRRLAIWLAAEKISVCLISSTLFRSLCQFVNDSRNFPDLRFLRLVSESGYTTDVELFRNHFSSSCILIHGLSSSETGPLCTYFIRQDTEIPGNELPVGYALEGKEILLLDDKGRELGCNEVGEIVVRSRYLSPGYWRRPDLTEAKFKLDPHDPEKRLYYTGDLGLMLPDGCLIHKGRKDFRVKIRGYGVEIAEVEKFLRELALIKDTVVVARQNEMEETRLIAYFTSSTQQSPTTSELREFLIKKVPDYMIPSAFVRLEALPLTLNGKVDRKALLEPAKTRPELKVSYVAPRTTLEEKLCQIWAGVLSLDHVGIHDNFFDLGGHSLAATRVVSQVIKNFQLELPLQSLFQSPTIAAMAAVIMEHQGKRLGEEELERVLGDLESLSDEEARRLLAEETTATSRRARHE